nr:site-specific integrase [Sphingomonas daechungensis]
MRAIDVDLTAGAIHFPDTKSGKPRWVHLTDEGIEFFRRHCLAKKPDDVLFTNENGRQYGASHQVRPMKEAITAAGLEGVGFHILRHTYASRLAMAGVPIAVIAEALGHADERITRRHYAHLSPSYVRDAIRAGLGRMGIFESDNVAPLVA